MKTFRPIQIIRQLLATIVLPLCLCSCGSRHAGKYVDESNPSRYIELKSDGTFFMVKSDGGFTGKYEVSGQEITVTAGIFAARGTIQDGKIHGLGSVNDVLVKK